MGKVMVFIDHENFHIALIDYYHYLNLPSPKLDYNKIPQEIVKMIPGNHELMKTFLFAPAPDDFLIKDDGRKKAYNWIIGLRNQKYFSVIEGKHIARPTVGYTSETMDVKNGSSYYVEEKGTDINIATHVITKAFLNSYDIAVIVSGDSDYIPVLNVLETLGKTSVVVGVERQNITRLRQNSDDAICLDKDFFNRCLR